MARITWIADVLRKVGCKVYEMPGWQTSETRSGYTQQGLVCHHTATGPNWSDSKVRDLLRNGRSDLSGPLSQLGLRRDGTYDIIAAGRANHNGYGQWGNDSIGIEAYNDGVGEKYPAAQYNAYVIGSAAICRHQNWKVGNVKGHKETDPKRKIDPTFDMGKFRVDVGKLLVPGTTPTPTPPKPTPLPGDDDMAVAVKGNKSSKVYATTWVHKKHILNQSQLSQQILTGLHTNNGKPFVVDQATIDAVPDAK